MALSSVLHKVMLYFSISIPRLLTGLAWLLLLRERVGHALVVDGDDRFVGWGLAIVCWNLLVVYAKIERVRTAWLGLSRFYVLPSRLGFLKAVCELCE